MIRLSVDFEHASRTWWDSGGRDLWRGITDDLDDSAVVLDRDLAQSWLAEASAIPGWDDGPDYAPHPITATPVDPDEVE